MVTYIVLALLVVNICTANLASQYFTHLLINLCANENNENLGVFDS